MATLGTWLYTKIYGKKTGEDESGNTYYQSRKPDSYGKIKRWVIYKGKAEASKVPPKWHGWLHYTTDVIPEKQYDWQKPHKENQTGTKQAYFPPGDPRGDGKRKKATGDYEAWRPN